jgi:transposase
VECAGESRVGTTTSPALVGQRREDLLGLLKMLDLQIEQMDQAVTSAAQQNEQVRFLMTQPGVGPATALAFVLTIGDVKRFDRSKHVASSLGLIPRESSSGGKQRMDSISKQGSRFLRYLLVEAASSSCDLILAFVRNMHTVVIKNIAP